MSVFIEQERGNRKLYYTVDTEKYECMTKNEFEMCGCLKTY
jgi:hypothetical protein